MHDFKDIKKILVIKFRHIGDVLLSVPVFSALKENFPDAYISALVNSETKEVLTGNPIIDEILVFKRDIKKMKPVKKYTKELAFLRIIRRKDFDLVVDLTSGDRAAIVSFMSGARYRLAYDPWGTGFLGKKYLYTHLTKKDRSQHMVLQNINVVRSFGINTNNLTVNFFMPDESRISARNILKENNINENDKIVHLHPTSRWLFKCWKDEYMAEIISWLVDMDIKVVVTSGPQEREIDKAKRILSLVSSRFKVQDSRLLDLCGKTTIKELAAISEASDLFLGVDSAPMHIAAAVGTPVIALFGPTGAFNWGPWDNTNGSEVRSQKLDETPYQKRNGIQILGMHTVIQKDWECLPCGKDGCNGSKVSKCLEEITPVEIKHIIGNRLDIKINPYSNIP